MGELPSRYSSAGLSAADQKKVITVGKPRHNRPIGALKIEERVHDAINSQSHRAPGANQGDIEGDIIMIGMDDEEEVQVITDYVTDKRETEPSLFITTPSMDFEESFENVPVRPRLSRETFMVVDTNFMISHLDIIDHLAKLHAKFHHKLVIPVTVVKELDGLKASKKSTSGDIDGVTVGHLARWANDWTYNRLATLDSAVRGQKMREKLDMQTTKDDSILDCALYLREKENALVILLSNDKNLCMKALVNEIPTVSYRKEMTAELISCMAFEENRSSSPEPKDRDVHSRELTPMMDEVPQLHQITQEPELDQMEVDQMADDVYGEPMQQSTPTPAPQPAPPQLQQDRLPFAEASSLIYSEVQRVVLGAIDYCMYAEYEDDIELIGYDKSKVLSLRDAANVLIKYWVSVFTEYFSVGSFAPFNRHGKKQPAHIRVPFHKDELDEFVEYWGNVLHGLYIKRDDTQNQALVKIMERWEGLSKNSYD